VIGLAAGHRCSCEQAVGEARGSRVEGDVDEEERRSGSGAMRWRKTGHARKAKDDGIMHSPYRAIVRTIGRPIKFRLHRDIAVLALRLPLVELHRANSQAKSVHLYQTLFLGEMVL
jgi:hypothetical protein